MQPETTRPITPLIDTPIEPLGTLDILA